MNLATSAVNQARSKLNADNAQISANNSQITVRKSSINELNALIEPRIKTWQAMLSVGDTQRAGQFFHLQIEPSMIKRDTLQREVNSYDANNVALRKDAAVQTTALNQANAQLSAAQARLKKALADAEAKRKAEAARQAAEEARLRTEQEAAARAKAEADRRAKEEAEAATRAAALEAAYAKLEQPNVFDIKGFPAQAALAAPVSFAETGLGGFSMGEAAATAAWTTVRTVLADLMGAVLAGSGVGALIASVAYVPGAGEGSANVPGREDVNMFLAAMPLDAIGLPAEPALIAAADAVQPVEMAVRARMLFENGVLKTSLVRTINPSLVRVMRASVDKVTGLYSVTIPAESGLPARTVLISPVGAPGFSGFPPLVTPVHHEVNPPHTGNPDPVVITPHIESLPMADDLDFRDIILIFPPESGLQPSYIVLESSRNMPGTVTGSGKDAQGTGDWLDDAQNSEGAHIPTRIANRLHGRQFRNFDKFREALWGEVAADPDLASQFDDFHRGRMYDGSAPRVGKGQNAGKRRSHELHHVDPISEGGEVYNVDNIRVLTPKQHVSIHSKKGDK